MKKNRNTRHPGALSARQLDQAGGGTWGCDWVAGPIGAGLGAWGGGAISGGFGSGVGGAIGYNAGVYGCEWAVDQFNGGGYAGPGGGGGGGGW
jgi:hypothetical protein